MAQAASVDHPVWQDVPTRPFQLVLEGGAMRGLFTAGVLDFFLDHGLLAESVVGTSMGAICGYNYACGATGRMAYINMKYRND
jgi:predicted patatin/cPLA2 family phospholipase